MHPVGVRTRPSTCSATCELIEHLDRLGFDEAWIGEHHSSGFETIASPEVFIAAAAERTRHIKLGTGVSSLPYHHPLILADRIVMLDHLTQGRMMFGVGPGQLTSDAAMLGIDTDEQRRMMEESFDVIMALFHGEIVTAKTDWFTVDGGRLQLRPYSTCSTSRWRRRSRRLGPKIAGHHGVGLLSIAATNPLGFEMLAGPLEGDGGAGGRLRHDRRPSQVADDGSDAHRRDRGAGARQLPLRAGVGCSTTSPTSSRRLRSTATTYEERVQEMNATGSGVVGTPEMAIAQIQRLIDQSGGFGAYLVSSAATSPTGRRRCAPTSCSRST